MGCVRMANEMRIDGLFDMGVLACLFAYKPDAFGGDRLSKTVSGKKQHGPEDKAGHDADGNEGSKGQNLDPRRSTGTGKEPGDSGDDRGRSRASH